jgi:hypothetical protein
MKFPCSNCGSRNWPRLGTTCPLCWGDPEDENETEPEPEMNQENIQFEIVPAELNLEPAAKTSLETAFVGFFERARILQAESEKITDPKEARALRLRIKAERVEAEKTRKRLKEDSLRMGKAIDGANNIFLAVIAPIEQAMEDIEKEKERRIERERIELEQSRMEKLRPYLDPAMPLPSISGITEDQFCKLLEGTIALHDMRVAAIKKAEEDRIERERKEAEQREAQRLENIRLKAEAEAREKQMAEERRIAAEKEAVAQAERKAAEEKARKEREEIEAKAAQERAEAEAKAREEAASRAKAESEARALREAEAKRIADEKAAAEAKRHADELAARKAAAAPDKEKLMAFAQQVRSLQLPEVKSPEAQSAKAEIQAKVASFAKWIETQASTI